MESTSKWKDASHDHFRVNFENDKQGHLGKIATSMGSSYTAAEHDDALLGKWKF